MKEKIFTYLNKINFIYVLKIDESYFKPIHFKKKQKLSKEVVNLNYLELSPYIDSKLFYNERGEYINLWFTDKKTTATIVLPESLILSKYFIENSFDGIFIFDTQPQKLLIVKNKMLLKQLSKETFSTYERELFKKEFLLNEITTYTPLQYKEIFKDALNYLSMKDLFSFLTLDLDYKTFFMLLINKITIPFAIFISLLFAIELANFTYVNKQTDIVKKEYKKIRKSTQALREKLEDIKSSIEVYQPLRRELKSNQNFTNSVKLLSGVLQDTNSSLLFVRVSGDELRVKIDTNVTATVFKKMIDSGVLIDLRIQSSRKNRYSDTEQVIITGKFNDKQ